jgi:hypothetical protein
MPIALDADFNPVCPIHGRMQHRFITCLWVCNGYDGEGCEWRVTDEQLAREDA